MDKYMPVIGLEIHVELKTASKMFCGCKNDPFFAKQPNSYTCGVCLGMPGGLPVPNRKAVEWTLKLGLALGCEIPLLSKFDRKNYFYPDLAKGYQISQYDQPLCLNGKLEVDGGVVNIRRVHLEEDTGKLLHTTVAGKKVTLIDFNRSGVPLVEIVTEPDIKDGEQAKGFLKKLHQVIHYLDISDADMEKGSMRLEPNISVKTAGQKGLPDYKVEVKNINSFNFVKRAIEYELKRQIQLLTQGRKPVQETRGWSEPKGITYLQRVKEEADDYRYFPEPDIPPMRWSKEYLEKLRRSLPELPQIRQGRFMKQYGLNAYDALLLTETPQLASYFEECVRVTGKLKPEIPAKKIANWLINRTIDLKTELPAKLVSRIRQASQTTSISKAALEMTIKDVLKANSRAVNDYKRGKQQALMFLVGQVMRATKMKLDAYQVHELLAKKLHEK